MASETELVSTSLYLVGSDEITSFDADTSKRARIVRRLYPRLRDRMLSQYRWNFAIRRISLVVDVEQPEFGFERQFSLPDDTLALWETSLDRRLPYTIERGKLLTDEPDVGIVYTPRIVEVSEFTEGFRTCLELLLAAHIAVPVVNNGTLRASFLDEFQQTLLDVLPREGQENATPVLFVDDLHVVRFTRTADIFDVDVDPSVIAQSPFG